MDEAKNRRKILNYYDKVVQGKSLLTIHKLENIENISELGTEKRNDVANVSQNLIMLTPKAKTSDRLDESLKKADDILEVEE